jgi:nucleoside-diphosphate-sugar epimerase
MLREAGKAVRLLVTGASGFLGRELVPRLLARGHTVYALAHTKPPPEGAVPLLGDVTKPGLGIVDPPELDGIVHLAAVIDLSNRHRERIWAINTEGTRHALCFAAQHGIPRFYFASTAFTQGRNPYEVSKAAAERDVEAFSAVHGIRSTVYKLAILAGSLATYAVAGAGGFYDVVKAIARVHRRAEVVRRKVEGTLRLPPVELPVRLPGDPDARLNLIPVDWAAEVIASTLDREGTFYVTHPDPPTLADLARWVGEALYLRISIVPEFRPTPLEALLARMIRPFLPYMRRAEPFPFSFDSCPPITREFIIRTVEEAFR